MVSDLAVLVWEAKRRGTSYGEVVATLQEGELERIRKQYASYHNWTSHPAYGKHCGDCKYFRPLTRNGKVTRSGGCDKKPEAKVCASNRACRRNFEEEKKK